jgi:2-amino-4-hydroxy-6-hydroxymethyldihydropteridine diphosphokinase
MTWVTLGIGSNIDPYNNLTSCLDTLLLHFNDMSMSSVFQSEAVGYEGSPYLNMVVGVETAQSLREILAFVKDTEKKHGREPDQPSLSETTLDIDVLTFGQMVGEEEGITLPREEILTNAFVLWPLSQVAGRHKHPVAGVSYADLWQAFDRDAQELNPVNFEWHGRVISKA